METQISSRPSSENASSNSKRARGGSRDSNRSGSVKSSPSVQHAVSDPLPSNRGCDECSRDSDSANNWQTEADVNQEWGVVQDDVFLAGTMAPCSACRKVSEPKSVDSYYSNLVWRHVPPNDSPNSLAVELQNVTNEESIVTSVGSKTILVNNIGGERNSMSRSHGVPLQGREAAGPAKRASNASQPESVSLIRGVKPEMKKVALIAATVVAGLVVLVAVVMLVGFVSKSTKGKGSSKSRRKKRSHATTVVTGFPLLDRILEHVHHTLMLCLD